MSRPSWYKVLENAREASLELAAAVAEGYAQVRREGDCRRDCDDDDDDDVKAQTSSARRRHRSEGCRDRGDFLSDWMRLNLQYMSEVAMLGSSYASVAARGLSALYAKGSRYSGYDACGAEAHQRCEVELCGAVDDPVAAEFSLRNARCDGAEFEIRDLVDGKIELEFREIGAGSEHKPVTVYVSEIDGKRYVARPLDTDEKLRLVIRLRLVGFEPGKRYRAHLRGRLAGHSKAIHLIVHTLQK